MYSPRIGLVSRACKDVRNVVISVFDELEQVRFDVPIRILPKNLTPLSEMLLVFPLSRGTVKLLSTLEPLNEKETHLSGLICRSRSKHLV